MISTLISSARCIVSSLFFFKSSWYIYNMFINIAILSTTRRYLFTPTMTILVNYPKNKNRSHLFKFWKCSDDYISKQSVNFRVWGTWTANLKLINLKVVIFHNKNAYPPTLLFTSNTPWYFFDFAYNSKCTCVAANQNLLSVVRFLIFFKIATSLLSVVLRNSNLHVKAFLTRLFTHVLNRYFYN